MWIQHQVRMTILFRFAAQGIINKIQNRNKTVIFE
jgi:hypothetical protein